MSAKILKFVRPVNGVTVEQRVDDGFINGTAMCVAHGKRVVDWLRYQETFDLFVALSKRLGYESKVVLHHDSDVSRLSATDYVKLFPNLITVRRGSPENGGGTWIHHKLAVQLAQKCSTEFALQVSDWVEEWLMTGRNPVHSDQNDVDREWLLWKQRYDIRVELKDFLRPELMNTVVAWAEDHGVSPITLCSAVHDAMNERIQGAKAKQIRVMGGLPLGALLRDYFEIAPLASYSAINRIAKNAIIDRGIEPVQAVHEACDVYLGKAFTPKLVPITENLYSQGCRLRETRRQKQLERGIQLSFLPEQAS